MAENMNNNAASPNEVNTSGATHGAAKAAKTVAVAGAKLASQNYAGAARVVVQNYGKELLVGLAVLPLVLIVIFTTIFASGPKLAFGGIGDWLEDKKTEIVFTKAQKVIDKQFNKYIDNIYDDVIKNITGGYIPSVSDKVKKLKEGKMTDNVGDGYFNVTREKGTDNVLIFELTGNAEYDNKFGRVVRLKNVYNPSTTSFDSLRFILAYSLYHQRNDLGSDDDYTEPETAEERWEEVSTKGLKKFLKQNKSKFFWAEYKATNEDLSVPTTNGAVVYNSEVITVSVKSITQSGLDTLFGLTADEESLLDAYYEIAVSLLDEGGYDSKAVLSNVAVSGATVSIGSSTGQTDNSMLTDKQQKVVKKAKSKGGTGVGSTCQKWVRLVYEEALKTKSDGARSAKAAEKKWGGNALPANASELPAGCTIYSGGGTWGHVGIYGGDGKVYHNYYGKKTVESYADYVKKHKATSWGWQNDDDLRK